MSQTFYLLDIGENNFDIKNEMVSKEKISIKTILIGLILLINICQTASAQAQHKVQYLKFKLVDNKIFINVYVNQKGPYNFQYDSGASGLGRLDEELVKSLALEDGGIVENNDGNSIRIEKMAKVKTLKFGGIVFKNSLLMYRKYNSNTSTSKIDGLIGRDFFKDWLIAIDYPKQTIEVSKKFLLRNEPGVMTYEKAFFVKGRIGNVEGLFAFDTGSSQRFHFPEKIVNQVKNQPNGLTSVTKRANTVYHLTETELKDTIWMGNKPYVNQKINYSTLATWINVGTGFLKEHKITFDQRNKLVKIE